MVDDHFQLKNSQRGIARHTTTDFPKMPGLTVRQRPGKLKSHRRSHLPPPPERKVLVKKQIVKFSKTDGSALSAQS
jgi:hypothetical protein